MTRRLAIVVALAASLPLGLAAQPASLADLLGRPVLAPNQTRVDTQVWTASRVPPLDIPSDAVTWEREAAQLRTRILDEVIYRGAARTWRTQPPRVEPVGDLQGDGYLVRKLRFEAVPGLWVAALLYVPMPAPTSPTPVVINVNGHEGTGNANSYIQARCITLAKRGVYALNVEYVGRGARANAGLVHYRLNQLDLVGTSGVAVFYEPLRKAVDYALTLPNADATRIGITGLSGGGWQTIILASLDTRVTLAASVAGFSSYVTRAQWPTTDLGDSEQTPSDLAAVADYTHLGALVAPRPLLLAHNARDACCFRADYAVAPLLQMTKPVYARLGASNRLAWHVNHDEGHNYERDNREAFYRFVQAHFFSGSAGFDPVEPELSREIRTEEALAVPMPSDNTDFPTLARRILDAQPARPAPQRDRLRELVRAPRYSAQAIRVGASDSASFWHLKMDHWTVPATEVVSGTPTRTSLVLSDAGRAKAATTVGRLTQDGHRVVAVDPFYFGESALGDRDFLFGLLVSSLGERPLGIQAAQVIAAARWLHARDGQPVQVVADGPRTSLIALVAAALEPDAISGVETTGAWSTLRSVIDQNISAEQMPEMFAFGLLAEFDVPETERLVQPRPIVRR